MDKMDKNKFVLQLEEEINELENKIKKINIENFKNKSIMNLKISAKICQLLAPYTLAATIVISGFKIMGVGFPFYTDDIKKYSNYMREFDNYGNVRTEQQYEKYDNTNAILNYCGKWNKNDDGTYSRLVQTYSLKNISKEEVLKILNEELTINDFLSSPIRDFIETSNNLTEEEINHATYIKATMYDIDKDDYIIVKESVDANVFSSIGITIVILIVELVILYFRDKISKFDFEYCINEIKSKYKYVDKNELVKKLEIRKSNYNRLLRK